MRHAVRNVALAAAMVASAAAGVLAYRLPAYFAAKAERLEVQSTRYDAWGLQLYHPHSPVKLTTNYDDPAQSEIEIQELSLWKYLSDPGSSEWTAERTRPLTHHPANDNEGAWSPDGTRIAYVSERHVPELGKGTDHDLVDILQGIESIRSSHGTALPEDAGRRIAELEKLYDTTRDARFRWHLVVAEPDGRGGWDHRQLTRGDRDIHEPLWFTDAQGRDRIMAYDESGGEYLAVDPQSGAATESSLRYSVHPGSPAPEFTLTDLASGEPRSLSDYEGMPVVITAFETWCVPCRDEIRVLDEVAAEYRGTVAFLALTADEDGQTVQYLRSLGASNLTVLVDESEDGRGNRTSAFIRSRYSGDGIPVTAVVNQSGFIADFHRGNRFVVDDKGQTLRESLDGLLEQ